MEWLTWPLVVLLGLVMGIVSITSVAIRVDWVEFLKYRDEKKAAKLLAKIQSNCEHNWVDQSPAVPFAFCMKCGKFVNSFWVQEEVRQGRITKRE